MSKFVVGLTGGIGSGKTTVANLFAEEGICLVDADVVAREVVAPGTHGLNAIISHFGTEMLTASGELDRAKLRQRVFNDEQERQWLNQLLHPMIRQEMLLQVEKATSDYVIMVVPLLFENGLDRLVHRTLVVDISPELQISRTVQRDNVDATQVNNIINSQCSRSEKLARADDIIDNHGEISRLKREVHALHQRYLQLSGNHNAHD
ncbi:dephospho-CoA kinase [Shewanella oneidensis MR-1]|uniref:Dephospho-CoA kinase n=1 Tax=Shewanella oneidensis (strain ATCC 700550 / JCM 31522 / CIP 106686 / LMG 19005 / NCIMB 14063 / MR-1) TaxID=211586 RepID=COAE_SHEON|nr:dephospho-CoA kinase [Shewanella oneidensis]Q8EJP9.1 RecName: Full=Dephospho-CoA kinase; AltName: Full=Dephosphocoenzyme A kinase [Shewanella oneidensis MR-1]AAN53496.1 dephospho-CoA kinase CoaE [Shewanella oneidensis MR-1]MDX5997635.1 dephospho-CoA kinase [Shewanella oneidensis]MEE2027652.1 Dephospho-CoA kinase [Shewanella oneidensis]QKG95344.1 dephospho-CoA kinase [Shewanella oneidensis MR-1]